MKKTTILSIAVLLWFLSAGAALGLTRPAGEAPAQVVVKITAKKFKFEPGKITVHQGDQVKLLVTSVDVDHGIGLSEFGIDRKVKKGTTETIEFVADKEGKFTFFCSVFCGDGHPDMAGELIVTKAVRESASAMQVSFDADAPGVVYVEANGERLRIDTNAKTFARADSARPAPVDKAEATTLAKDDSKPHWTSEPYDYQLINVPTPKRVPRHSLNVHFSHRFSEAINPQTQKFSDVAKDLFGLDSFSVSSLGFSYGFTDRLYGKVSRSPVCDRQGLCKTIELGFGYHLLDQAGKSPIALSIYNSIEGDDNFTENYNYNVQVMMARSITQYVNVFFSPAIHFNANGNSRFNPNPVQFPGNSKIVEDFRLGQHTGSFGFGVNARIRPSTSLLFEFTPRVGFKLGEVLAEFQNGKLLGFKNRSEPEIGFGIEKRLGRHAFALTFSNTQTTTTSRYNSSNLGLQPSRFVIGFNIFRRLL
ncbi:MAG: cupredoxin domain-containing protein [Acidobacteria bacterium]|nr:cupredoxin domain-containing protein [Acidobacteriota bacterium]